MGRALLWVYAAVFAGLGVWALVSPAGLLAAVEVAPTGTGGVIELRAMYGGLELGLAGFLAWCALTPNGLRAGLVASILTVGGLGVVRLIGLLVQGSDLALLWLFAALEIGGTVLAVVLLQRVRA